MPKLAPPPVVAPETWRALTEAAAEFTAMAPWRFAYDSDVVGLIDPSTGETRIASVLGNAGEVFAAVFYRREAGLRWILRMIADDPEGEGLDPLEGMDCLKVEFVPKEEMWEEDMAVLNAADFKPVGRGFVWPQFRSCESGRHPWFVDQREAEQLLADLPRLAAFCKVLEAHPDEFEDRGATEIPFLPVELPDRPLTLDDIEWRDLEPPTDLGVDTFTASPADLKPLAALPRSRGATMEFDAAILPGGSFIEDGRPSYGRYMLLADGGTGAVVGMEVVSATLPVGEALIAGLVKSLTMAKALPDRIVLRTTRFLPTIEPFCSALNIGVDVGEVPMIDEALASLSAHLLNGE